jgi:pimeloyl-ACP methyl ester carboxylesterase
VLDPLGHGESDRPRDMTLYSFPAFGQQVLALMDHLRIEEAVVGGTSLGANITLEALAAAPERFRGAIVEMPVLDNALLGCALAFTPLLVAVTFGKPVTRAVASLLRRVPRTRWHMVNVGLDWVSQDPEPSGHYLQGLFFGRIAPPKTERSQIETPSLVIGHDRDPVHPFSDADALHDELRNSRMVQASWIGELRVSPKRLTNEIAAFVDECWAKPAGATRSRARTERAAARPAAERGH